MHVAKKKIGQVTQFQFFCGNDSDNEECPEISPSQEKPPASICLSPSFSSSSSSLSPSSSNSGDIIVDDHEPISITKSHPNSSHGISKITIIDNCNPVELQE